MENIYIKCPYCGFKHENWQDYIDVGDMDGTFGMICECCNKEFNVKFQTKIIFESEKLS